MEGELVRELYTETAAGRIPTGYRVLKVETPAGIFFCLTNRAKWQLQTRHPWARTTIWREGARLNGCGLGTTSKR
jgi:hypothetical protein